jgi:hypothetical protein
MATVGSSTSKSGGHFTKRLFQRQSHFLIL